MVESDAQVDVLAGLETAIEAFERGLDEYQTQFHAWSQDRRKLIGRETAMAEERTSASVRGLEERAQQLARDQDALAQDKAGLERFRAELDAFAAECDRRERASREREDSLGQKYSSHEETAASLQERTKQLDQRQCELQGRFEKSQQALEERKDALAAAEKEISEQRKRFDYDHQELARFRDELARRESELASQSVANKEAHKKLALLSGELDAERRTLATENETAETRRAEVDRRAAELTSLQSQLQAKQAEIDARTLALDADTQRLKQQSDVLAKREREFEQTAAKSTAEHQGAAHDLERRERELADATRALSARAEGLETVQCEIEARQQAAQTAAHEHQQHEKEFTETVRKFAKRQATFEEAEARLRASHQALQAERDELGTMRKSVEAELAAKRQESARKEAESLARRDQVERDVKAVEQRAQSIEGRSEELERRSKTLAQREGELNGQQAKLEAALQSLRNDQTAVEKARSVVTEVDESRWSELNKVRAELNAMRTENELARARERELEGSLGKVQAANAREMHAAEDARTEAARLAEQLEDEKRTAAEQRAAIFAQCLIAAGLKGPSADGEHEVLALLEGVKTKSAGSTALVVSSPNDSRVVGLPPDGGTLLVQRQASHTAVATFWADFKPVPKLVAKQPAAVSASIDLDPATANRLRMMRRLNPTKSDQELLAKISAEEKNPARVKQKKGWFALR